MAERADDPPTDLLDHVCHVGIAGRLARDKAGLEARFAAIEVNTLKEDDVKMEIPSCRPRPRTPLETSASPILRGLSRLR